MKSLYIIGNGFDKAHELKTSYWDFRCYLERYAEGFLVDFEKFYGFYPYDPEEYHVPKNLQKKAIENRRSDIYEVLWKTFEESLGNPIEDEIQSTCDAAINSMSDIEFGGIEDTLNEYFEEQFRFIINLQSYLLKWAKQIRLNKARAQRASLQNNVSDLFLTFNYTPVLERVYGIDNNQICHIHGGTPPYCMVPPIIGHGNRAKIEQRKKWLEECNALFDDAGSSINRAFANFYQRTFKDTDQAIKQNFTFFQKIRDAEEVIVIGHSLGDVDMQYFQEVANRTKCDIPWTVYYHNSSDQEKINRMVDALKLSKINVLHSDRFWDK